MAEMMSSKLTILRRDYLDSSKVTQSIKAEQEQEMKITGKKTYQESRANLDGKIIFIALAHADFLNEIEKLIKGEQYKELADFLV